MPAKLIRGGTLLKTAIVTGASAGMGRDFACEIAACGQVDEIWLIARRQDRLKELADELPVPSRIFAIDLLEKDSLDVYQNALKDASPDVAYLINASGFGRFAHSLEVPLNAYFEMIDLNVKALTALCFLTIPYMGKNSAIINMGSLSSFQPVPYINVYGATKAYVLSFSRALNVELRSRGIRVMSVCPGWVETEFFDHAVLDNDAVSFYNKIWKSKDVVAKAMKDLSKGKDVSILGTGVRMQVLLTKLLPHKLVMNVWMKQQKHR
jgi:short-subunit dehydrogenase